MIPTDEAARQTDLKMLVVKFKDRLPHEILEWVKA